jgi:hypothetical protein
VSVLDDPALYALDQSGMFEHIKDVGQEFIRAWATTENMENPARKGTVDNVIIAGVGGSGSLPACSAMRDSRPTASRCLVTLSSTSF